MFPTVIVLASGRGERFAASGGTVHKLQALLGDKTVLQHTLDAARDSGLPFHVEDAGHPGMGDSIAAAVRATRDAAGWLILPADLPLILPTTLLAVARAALNGKVIAPVFQGQRGHPVRFAIECGAELMKLSGPQGASKLVKAWGVTELLVDDIGCVTDIDTLDDLSRAQAVWHERAAFPAHGHEYRRP